MLEREIENGIDFLLLRKQNHFLKENDYVSAKIEKNDAVYRCKGTCIIEILTLFGSPISYKTSKMVLL